MGKSRKASGTSHKGANSSSTSTSSAAASAPPLSSNTTGGTSSSNSSSSIRTSQPTSQRSVRGSHNGGGTNVSYSSSSTIPGRTSVSNKTAPHEISSTPITTSTTLSRPTTMDVVGGDGGGGPNNSTKPSGGSGTNVAAAAAADTPSEMAALPGNVANVTPTTTTTTTFIQVTPLIARPRPTVMSLHEWILAPDRHGIRWIAGCIMIGTLFGFVLGAGWLDVFLVRNGGSSSSRSSTSRHDYATHHTMSPLSSSPTPGRPEIWRQQLANQLRSTTTYKVLTLQVLQWLWEDWFDYLVVFVSQIAMEWEAEELAQNPSHPHIFAVLREAIVRVPGGYVHPDLGFMEPAPCGAARGLGMVRNTYHQCQIRCMPGTAEEKRAFQQQQQQQQREQNSHNASLHNTTKSYIYIPPPIPDRVMYRQEEILIRVPLKYQMTRNVAVETLTALIPAEVQRRAGFMELDDAALLTLLLAHERGVGRFSPWMPYIATLPKVSSCGYLPNLRPVMLDAINALRDEFGVHVQGWSEELIRATHYANKIVDALARDYGPYIETPETKTVTENLEWALCQVASRATAGSERHGGALRMVPLVDSINHDILAGGIVELKRYEPLSESNLLGGAAVVEEQDSGTIIIRSMRNGRPKPLKPKQELLINYNVPYLSPLDWFVSMGFVPAERRTPWVMLDPVLPRVRKDGLFATPTSNSNSDTAASAAAGMAGTSTDSAALALAEEQNQRQAIWKEQETLFLHELKELEGMELS